MRQIKPARDRAAPWSSYGNKVTPAGLSERAVVYCLNVEGLDLIKIGRTTNLKRRITNLQREVRRPLHLAYWVEVASDIAHPIEQVAVKLLRGSNLQTRGEWSLNSPAEGAGAIAEACWLMGALPEFMGGAPSDEQSDDELAEVRANSEMVPETRWSGVNWKEWQFGSHWG